MGFLILDSSGAYLSVHLSSCDGSYLGGCNLLLGNRMSEELLPRVDAVLGECGVALSDIEGYCVVVGPGSFTGVRIGVATMLGITEGLGKKLSGITSIDACALALGKDDVRVSARLKSDVYASRSFNFTKSEFSNFELSNSPDSCDFVLDFKNDPGCDVILTDCVKHPSFGEFLRDHTPFYMRKSEAELNFDKKSKSLRH